MIRFREMDCLLKVFALVCLLYLFALPVRAGQTETPWLEQKFRELPAESRRMLGPLFFLHGTETKERLELELAKVAEGGNGCFTTESRPHPDWLGPGWFRDLSICLNAAKKHNLKMWIFDEKWFPSQAVGGKVPPQFAAKSLAAATVDVQGPRRWQADGYAGPRYIGAVAGSLAADGKIDGESLIDLAPFVRDGRLAWDVPAGKWKIIRFSHVQAEGLEEVNYLTVDGASKDCVDWFLKTVYQPHYDHFAADFGKTIVGFFYDEPVTYGDWGTELPVVLAERKVDWKKAYVAYKFELSGEMQAAARYQYLDAFADAWGRTMFGRQRRWCEAHGVKSIGHFIEHEGKYLHPGCTAGDMMRLQRYASMGAIDAVDKQFVMGRRETLDPYVWQIPKLASSISHVFGKPNDQTMVEIFGVRGQDITYPEMKWWADHMQVSGVNFLIPHSFNPRAPHDNDCPPYFYNGGLEPRWPLYRVLADYTCRLSLMLTGGRHVCPVALLEYGNAGRVGHAVMPEVMTCALQDVQFDCDWLPFDVLERDVAIEGRELRLYGERYRVLIVPPVEVIPYPTLAKVKQFYDTGGIVVGYGFLPSKSGTIGKTSEDIAAVRSAIWGDAPKLGLAACSTNAAGGRAYLLPEKPQPEQLATALTADAGVHPGLEVLEGQTDHWLHVLHRQKDGRDIFFVCNQIAYGQPRQFKFRAAAGGVPEWWDPMRSEITAVPFRRLDADTVELSLVLEPLETGLLVFQPEKIDRPARIDASSKPLREPIVLRREPNPPTEALPPGPHPFGMLTLSPIGAADPFRAQVALPADVDLARCRVYLEMDDLPDHSAAVTINGQRAGGVIGHPTRLEIARYLKPGENSVLIEPLAPRSARLTFYGAGLDNARSVGEQ